MNEEINKILEEARKGFEKTIFAKNGGSCFECSDFERMYVDLRDCIDSLISSTYQKGLEEGGRKTESKYRAIFEWLDGLTDFPERKEGEGAYYWRKHLREKIESLSQQSKGK